MPTPEDQVKTSIDALLDLIKAKGKSDINAISNGIGVSPAVVENWVKILEKGELVKISYELGKMYVAPVTAETREREVTKRVSVQQEILSTELETKLVELKRLSDVVSDLKSAVLTANKTYAERLPDLQQKLTEINRIYQQINKENAAAEKIRQLLEGTYDSINAKVAGLMEKIKFLDTQDLGGLPSTIRSEQDLLKQAREYQRQLNEIKAGAMSGIQAAWKEFDLHIKGARKEVSKESDELIRQLKLQGTTLAKSNETLNSKVKVAKGIMEEVANFNAEKNRQRLLLDRTVKEFADRYSKSYEAVSRGIKLLNTKANELLAGIEAVKLSFGDASSVYDMLRDVTGSVNSAEARLAGVRADIASAKKDLASLGKTADAGKKLSTVSRSSKKSDDIASSIETVRKEISAAVSKIKLKGADRKGSEEKGNAGGKKGGMNG